MTVSIPVQVNLQKRPKLIIIGAVILVVLLIGYTILVTRASGFFAAVDSSDSVLKGNASLVNDSQLPSGKAVQFNAPVVTPPTTPPPTTPPTTPPVGTLLGWQVNANTIGLKPHGLSCDSLPLYTGPEVLPAGTTISQKRIEGRLNARAGNITIEKSCIRPKSGDGPLIEAAYFYTDNNHAADGPITIRDSELDASRIPSKEDAARSDGMRGSANMYRNYIHGMGSGIAFAETDNKLSVIVENNYVDSLVSFGDGGTTGTHSDAFTIRDFAASGTARSATIRNNRFDCDGGNESGAFFIQPTFGRIDNVIAEGNLFEGGNYRMTLENHDNRTYSNIKAINNRIAPGQGNYGPVNVSSGPGFAQWTENYYYDAAKADAKGAIIAKP